MYNTGMVQVEEKLLEKYNDFELLLKEKFNNEINSVTDYVERMVFHKEDATKYISDWEDTITFLVSVVNKINVINKKKPSGVVTEDIDKLMNFMDSVKKYEDPLQKYYVTKGFETIMSEVENEDEIHVELDDPEYSTFKSYKSMYKIAPIVIVTVILVILALWAYMRMNASLL